MPVHTFSTRSTRPVDTDAVLRVKEHCDKHCLNFSAIVVTLLKEWEVANVTKVQSAKPTAE